MKKLKILIVEDDKVNAAVLNTLVGHLGHEVSGVTGNSEETIRNLKQNKPDLILMNADIKGEKMAIETTLDIYKKNNIPVIFLGDNFSDINQAKIANNSVFIPKPLNEIDLCKNIAKLVISRYNKESPSPHFIEEKSIKTVHRYEISDTLVDGSFDKIATLAALIFQVPVAIVSLVDKDRIWIKSNYGLRLKEADRESSDSSSAILKDEFYSSNGTKDLGFITNSLIAGENGFHFYTAAPLQTHDGHHLGTLSIMDEKPKALTKCEEEILSSLAGIVMNEIELRLAAQKAVKLQSELLSIAVHDLKNPTSGILGLSEIMLKEENTGCIKEMAKLINKSSRKMIHIIKELMEVSTIDGGGIKLKLTPVNMAELAEEVVDVNRLSAKMKNQVLKLKVESDPVIRVDREKMREVFDNLLSNAIKYSEKGKTIEVGVKEVSGKAFFEIKDNGQGLTDDDKTKLYGKFSRLSAQPTAGESSTGLGLSIAKMLVELHKGRIRAESDGKDKGSKFIVELDCEKDSTPISTG